MVIDSRVSLFSIRRAHLALIAGGRTVQQAESSAVPIVPQHPPVPLPGGVHTPAPHHHRAAA
eukprot:7040150-Pyramimonas_sp.AAC.1